MRRTVAASTDINIGLKRGIRIRRIAEAAFAPQPREQAEPGLRTPNTRFLGSKVDPAPTHKILSAKRPFPGKSPLTKPFSPPYVVVLKQSGDVVAARTSGGRVMSTIENDSAGSESWDPAIWSIGTVLGIAIVYLACLT